MIDKRIFYWFPCIPDSEKPRHVFDTQIYNPFLPLFLILSWWGSKKGSKWVMWNNHPKLLESWGVSCLIPLVHHQNCTVLFQNLGHKSQICGKENSLDCSLQRTGASKHISCQQFDLVTRLFASSLQRDIPNSFPWDAGRNCAAVHLLEGYSWTVIAAPDRNVFS